MDLLKRLLEKLTWAQRIWLLVGAVALVGGIMTVNRWNQESDFKPLFSNLDATDAGALVEQLKQSGTPYRLADNGATLLVPSGQVAEARLAMATAGLPKTGRIGFELFDKANFGASDFAEQVNYHRAVEGELERSVKAIREVEQARVHVTWAKDSLFTESRQPAKASVLVKLRPATRLTPQNVTAIAQLLASAVPELSPDLVAVIDTNGVLLNRPRRTLPGDDGNEAVLEYRKSIERDLQAKVNATLEPILGLEHFRASVFADVDLSSGDQSEELFDPQKAAVTTSQKSEDGPTLPVASGVPGAASNLPRPTSSPVVGTTNYARKTESTSYQTSRVIRHTKLPQGNIKKVSLSVLIDHTLRWDGKKRVVEPPTPEKLKVVHDLVAAATGINTARGDQLVVEAFPFESTLTAEPAADLTGPIALPVSGIPLPPWLQKFVQGKNLIVIGAAAGGGLLLVLGGMIFLLMRKGKKSKVTVAGGNAALAAAQAKEVKVAAPSPEELQKEIEGKMAEHTALAAKNEAEELLKLKMPGVATKKTDVLTKHIIEETKKDAGHMAQVIRNWLNDGSR